MSFSAADPWTSSMESGYGTGNLAKHTPIVFKYCRGYCQANSQFGFCTRLFKSLLELIQNGLGDWWENGLCSVCCWLVWRAPGRSLCVLQSVAFYILIALSSHLIKTSFGGSNPFLIWDQISCDKVSSCFPEGEWGFFLPLLAIFNSPEALVDRPTQPRHSRAIYYREAKDRARLSEISSPSMLTNGCST